MLEVSRPLSQVLPTHPKFYDAQPSGMPGRGGRVPCVEPVDLEKFKRCNPEVSTLDARSPKALKL